VATPKGVAAAFVFFFNSFFKTNILILFIYIFIKFYIFFIIIDMCQLPIGCDVTD
jgi:hypothetical protein